jgi:hypothetical protein
MDTAGTSCTKAPAQTFFQYRDINFFITLPDGTGDSIHVPSLLGFTDTVMAPVR